MAGGAVLAVVAAGTAALPSATAASGTTYYVATTGSDSAKGGAGTPFRTIQKCADVAVAGDTCRIAGGTYRETVTPAHSGTAAAPITFTSAPGAQVTVDGRDVVTGWTLDSGHIYKAPVTLSGTAAEPYSSTAYPADSDLWANQVFTGGTLVPEAAYPPATSDPWTNTSASGWTSTRTSNAACAKPPCTTVLTGTMTYSQFPALGDMTGATAYFTGGWVANSADITGGTLDGSNKTLQMSFPESDNHIEPGSGASGSSGPPYFRIVGKKSLLRGPNAWYYDAGAHELYMWAPDGSTPTGVLAKKRNYGFDLNARSNVTVHGIGLFATSLTTDDSSSHDVLDGITGQYLSTWQTSQFDENLAYAGVYDANHHSDSGILLHGTDNTLRNSTLRYSMGNGVSVKGSGHVITNNLISDVAYGATYTAAIALEVNAKDVVITHNTMHSTARDVINMNTNVYPNDGYKNLRIAYNNTYDYAKINHDLGAIYACCNTAYTGTRIDHNWFHDPAQIGNGVHLDNGSYDLGVDHDVAWNLKGGHGISQGGWISSGYALPYLTSRISNNTLVSNGYPTIFNYYAYASQVANTVTRNNILDGSHPAGQTYDYIAGGQPDESNDLVTTHSKDGGSPDPLYTDPSAGDFALRAGSPAIDAGTTVPGITDGFSGKAPDQGAYESGQADWVPGCTFTGCGASAGTDTVLVARHSGKAAAVSASRGLVQQTLSTSTAQRWTLTDLGDGFVRVVNRASGKCLDVAGASGADGAAVVPWTCGKQLNQQWTLADTGQGYVHLVGRHSGKCLDVAGASTADGAHFIQWTCDSRTNQQWTAQNVA